jgi:thiazole synthase ThiGH ThiG subunit
VGKGRRLRVDRADGLSRRDRRRLFQDGFKLAPALKDGRRLALKGGKLGGSRLEPGSPIGAGVGYAQLYQLQFMTEGAELVAG